MKIAGDIFIFIGIIFISFGLLGIFRFSNFYSRIAISSKIDTVGFISIMFGLLLYNGISWLSMKLILLIAICMIINPVITHAIARSAYYSGYRINSYNNCEIEKNKKI